MHYYGIDWISRAVIAWSIIEQGRGRFRRSIAIFMLVNVLCVSLALISNPPMWGSVIGDCLFFLMNLRNWLKYGRTASASPGGTKSAPGDASGPS